MTEAFDFDHIAKSAHDDLVATRRKWEEFVPEFETHLEALLGVILPKELKVFSGLLHHHIVKNMKANPPQFVLNRDGSWTIGHGGKGGVASTHLEHASHESLAQALRHSFEGFKPPHMDDYRGLNLGGR